jgi:hypothetical protein
VSNLAKKDLNSEISTAPHFGKKEERKLARAAHLAYRIKGRKKRTSKRDIHSDTSSGSGGGVSSKAITPRNQL